jgi:hypothetical protein
MEETSFEKIFGISEEKMRKTREKITKTLEDNKGDIAKTIKSFSNNKEEINLMIIAAYLGFILALAEIGKGTIIRKYKTKISVVS